MSLTLDLVKPGEGDAAALAVEPGGAFARPDDDRTLVEIARALSADFATRAGELDTSGSFPRENIDQVRRSGLLLMALPPRFGGRDASMLDVAQILAVLAAGCPSTALILNMHFALSGQLAHMARLEPQGRWTAWLRHIAQDRLLLGGALSEAGSWNAVMFPRATAERVEGGYRVNADRSFCTGSSELNLIQGTAVETLPDGSRQSIYFLFTPDQTGVTFKGDWDTLGMRGSHSQGVRLNDALIREEQILFRYGYGQLDFSQVWLSFLAWSFIGFASVYAGIAQAARDVAVKTITGRKRLPGTDEMAHKPSNQIHVARLDILNATMRSVREDTARRWPIDTLVTPQTILDTAVAKYVCVTEAPAAVDHAIAVVGGQAYFTKLPLERLLRDVRAGPFHPFSADDTLELLGKFAFGIPFLAPGGWAI